MNHNELAQVFNDSYERVMHGPGKRGEFFSVFYATLVAKSPEAVSKFRNTDMEKQVHMLKTSVLTLVNFYGTGCPDAGYLEKLAERHSKRGVDIPPALYAVWLDCLIETLRGFDVRFNDDVETAWRVLFSKGIEFMASRYESRP